MRKLVTVILMLALFMALCACGTNAEEAAQAPADRQTVGTLTLLNLTEDEYSARMVGKTYGIHYLVEQNAFSTEAEVKDVSEVPRIVFYDTLDALLMALEVGDINSAEVPQCTADYLCANNDAFAIIGSFDLDKADEFTKQVAYRLGVGFSFLTTEDRFELRNRIDQVLTDMKADGTLDALIQAYITDAVSELEPVKFEQTDGETLRVAITGALPPMDYVAADGNPAGFNTALLAELGKRLNMNIELSQVDSVGRAAALASRQVDLVFWTNGADGRAAGRNNTFEEHVHEVEDHHEEWIDAHPGLMVSISGGLSFDKTINQDIPEGTITTQPYYSDLMVLVIKK